ncbi:MAG: hypothetical protein QM703_01600 [Gemmatales bacterium]
MVKLSGKSGGNDLAEWTRGMHEEVHGNEQNITGPFREMPMRVLQHDAQQE